MNKPHNIKISSLNTTFTYGRHKGKPIRDVIYEDPHYLDWLITEQLIELDNTAYLALQTHLKYIQQ